MKQLQAAGSQDTVGGGHSSSVTKLQQKVAELELRLQTVSDRSVYPHTSDLVSLWVLAVTGPVHVCVPLLQARATGGDDNSRQLQKQLEQNSVR